MNLAIATDGGIFENCKFFVFHLHLRSTLLLRLMYLQNNME